MAKEFKYQEPFPLGKDKTEYYLLTKEHVSVSEFDGQEILKVEPEAMTMLARAAMREMVAQAEALPGRDRLLQPDDAREGRHGKARPDSREQDGRTRGQAQLIRRQRHTHRSWLGAEHDTEKKCALGCYRADLQNKGQGVHPDLQGRAEQLV